MKGPVPTKDLESVRSILIIQYKPFGDVLLNTAYLPALRRRFPCSRIDFLVQKPFSVILEDNPNLDGLIVMERRKKGTAGYAVARLKLILEIRKKRYDMIIDQARGPGASQITLFSGARFRLGWHKTKKWSRLKGYNWVYNYRTLKDNSVYSARAKFKMLAPLGIEEDGSGTFLHLREESRAMAAAWYGEMGIEPGKTVVFSPVTPIRRRQWDLDRFAALADMIIEEAGFNVVFLWGPGEEEKVRRVVSMMDSTALVAPSTTFNEAGAFIEKAAAYIGNNGGIHHLATAVGTPTLTVFGPCTNPMKWTAWHLPVHMHVKNPELGEYVDGTLGLEPGKVFRKFLELMDAAGSYRR